MAGVLVPLIASAAPDIINGVISLITSLVHKHAATAEVSGNPGPVKFADVFVAVMQALTSAHAAGQIAAIPDDSFVKVVIQSVVTSLKLPGNLLADVTPTPPITQTNFITIKSGQIITITGV